MVYQAWDGCPSVLFHRKPNHPNQGYKWAKMLSVSFNSMKAEGGAITVLGSHHLVSIIAGMADYLFWDAIECFQA